MWHMEWLGSWLGCKCCSRNQSSEDKVSSMSELSLPPCLPIPAALALSSIIVPPEVDKSEPLSLGIFYHELNEFAISSYYFSAAASRGAPLGLFFYGMCLRHGWGVEIDAKRSFACLQKSAQLSLSQIQPGSTAPSSAHRMVAKLELSQAIFELAISFKEGWGVRKSLETALHYLEIAARLNDRCAQMELGEWYLRGFHVPHDKQMAAKWFRLAANQGARMVSMDWIWKEKYDLPSEESSNKTNCVN